MSMAEIADASSTALGRRAWTARVVIAVPVAPAAGRKLSPE